MNPKPFWRGVFSESDGKPSFCRVATGLLLLGAMGWVSHIVWHSHALPDFAGLALLLGTLLGLNKVTGIFDKGKPPGAS